MKEYQVINILEGIYEECVRDNDKDYMERNTALTGAIKALTEIQYYRAIGTVEEYREAKERQIPKKPIAKNEDRKIYMCQCGSTRINTMDNFCCICGQKLDWKK